MKLKIKVWVPLIFIILIIFCVTFLFMHNLNKKVKENGNEIQNSQNFTGSEQVKNEDIEENKIRNEENEQKQATTTKTEENKNTTTSKKGTYTAGATDDKEKAIELVKAEYGESDSFNFVFDYINEEGEYVIAVKEKETAEVVQYFRVNLDTETVELD